MRHFFGSLLADHLLRRPRHFLGSGRGEAVLAEAGLDGDCQYRAIRAYIQARRA